MDGIVEWPLPLLSQRPPRLGAARDGTSPLEVAALSRVERCLASLPAVLLYRLALWPDLIPDLAREHGRSPSSLYNALAFARRRPNRPARQVLARRVSLPGPELDHAIEMPRAPIPPATPAPGVRDGQSALEQLALSRVRENLAAMNPGLVLSLVVWPFSLAELAAATGCAEEHLYQAVAALRGPFRRVRERVASFVGVEDAVLDHLLDADAAEPVHLPAGK